MKINLHITYAQGKMPAFHFAVNNYFQREMWSSTHYPYTAFDIQLHLCRADQNYKLWLIWVVPNHYLLDSLQSSEWELTLTHNCLSYQMLLSTELAQLLYFDWREIGFESAMEQGRWEDYWISAQLCHMLRIHHTTLSLNDSRRNHGHLQNSTASFCTSFRTWQKNSHRWHYHIHLQFAQLL